MKGKWKKWLNILKIEFLLTWIPVSLYRSSSFKLSEWNDTGTILCHAHKYDVSLYDFHTPFLEMCVGISLFSHTLKCILRGAFNYMPCNPLILLQICF